MADSADRTMRVEINTTLAEVARLCSAAYGTGPTESLRLVRVARSQLDTAELVLVHLARVAVKLEVQGAAAGVHVDLAAAPIDVLEAL